MKRSTTYAALRERERQRLRDLGLEGCETSSVCYEVISKMRMRSLDQTKMLLSRIANSSNLFPDEIRRGIMKNDLDVFARAVSMLLFEQED